MSVSKSVYDNVHKPEHYTAGRKFEPKDVIRDWDLNFNLGNAVKYLARAGRKDDIVQDLKKAQEYIQFEIDAIEAQRAKAPIHPNCSCSVEPLCGKSHTKDIIRRRNEAERLHEMSHNSERKCVVEPVYAKMKNGEVGYVGTMNVTVPAGVDPEEFIKEVISAVYGGK